MRPSRTPARWCPGGDTGGGTPGAVIEWLAAFLDCRFNSYSALAEQNTRQSSGKEVTVKHNCRWVVRPYTPSQDAEYCGKSVGYSMVNDGNEPGAPKVRKYNTFCDEHEAKAASMEEVAAS